MSDNASFLQRRWSPLVSRIRGTSVADLLYSAWPVGLRLGGAFLQLFVTILIGRTLGAEAAGIYFFWTAAMLEAGQVGTFGLDRVAVQKLPRIGDGEGERARFLGTLRTTTLLISLVLSLGLIGYAVATGANSGHALWWYAMIPACACGVTMCMVNQEAATGLGAPILAVLSRHTFPTVAILIGVLLLGDFLTPDAGLVIFSFAFFASGFGILLVPGLLRMRPVLVWPSGRDLRGHLREGAPIFLCSLFAGLALMFPLSILERTHPSEEVAWLTTAFRIFVLLDVLAKAVYSVIMPDLSRAAEILDRASLVAIYRSSIVKGLLLLGIPIVGLFFAAPLVMEMFGEGFSGGTPVLQAFLGFGLLSLLMGPAHQLLLMVGKTRSMAVFSAIHFTICGTLGWILIPQWGALALAVIVGVGLIVEKTLYLGRAIHAVGRGKRENADD